MVDELNVGTALSRSDTLGDGWALEVLDRLLGRRLSVKLASVDEFEFFIGFWVDCLFRQVFSLLLSHESGCCIVILISWSGWLAHILNLRIRIICKQWGPFLMRYRLLIKQIMLWHSVNLLRIHSPSFVIFLVNILLKPLLPFPVQLFFFIGNWIAFFFLLFFS